MGGGTHYKMGKPIPGERELKVPSSPLYSISIHMYYVCTDSESGDQKSSHDFGLHPSDAEQEVGWQMRNGGVEEQLVTLGHEWHPGRLLYYNRAELKQSDHR